MNDYQVVWRGLVHDSTGYARLSRECVLALDEAGVDVKVEPVSYGTHATDLPLDKTNRLQGLIAKPVDPGKKKVLVVHLQPYTCDAAAAKQAYDKVICFTACETIPAAHHWIEHLLQYDGLFVSSTHNHDAFRQLLPESFPISVIPHALSNPVAGTVKPMPIGFGKDRYKFLSVCSWQHRKGIDILLEAFCREFHRTDPVALVLKVFLDNVLMGRKIRDTVSDYKVKLGLDHDTAPIYVTTDKFSDTEVESLYTACDAYVLPSRGEGFGLPYLEASAAGLPVIATNWGGHLDFLSESMFYPVAYTVEPSTTRKSSAIAPVFNGDFTDNTFWAEPSVDDLRKNMRHVFDNQDEAATKAKSAKNHVDQLSWSAAAQTMIGSIERLLTNA